VVVVLFILNPLCITTLPCSLYDVLVVFILSCLVQLLVFVLVPEEFISPTSIIFLCSTN
jgi:hypothetical protein